jgi:ABC-type amino acid transport substrate-binding protein
LTVATREVPPFAFRGEDGAWRGIAVDLWAGVAERLGVEYRFIELGLTEMLDAVAEGRADAAVAALTITSDRERRVDFSHPFHTSGLGIAVHQRPAGGLVKVLKRLFSGQFLAVLGGLLALLTVVGVLIWLAERRTNAHFPGAPAKGIGAGLWWSAVTMTTVGYGDKAPTTLFGRALAMVWMFAGLIIISGFTAAITTALTVG